MCCKQHSNVMARVLSPLLGLILLAAIGYGLYEILRMGLTALAGLDKGVKAAIVAASATILVSVITVVIGNVYASRVQIQKENRDRKIPVYEDLFTFFFRFMNQEKSGEVVGEREFAQFSEQFNRQFMVWGSDDVVSAYVKWRMFITDEKKQQLEPQENLFLFEDLVYAIRKDLGHTNKGLNTGDILSLFVNDVQSILPRK